MNEGIKNKLDEWFGSSEDYKILHHFISGHKTEHIAAVSHGRIYFMRLREMNREWLLIIDGIRQVYHHDDYRLVGGAKYVRVTEAFE